MTGILLAGSGFALSACGNSQLLEISSELAGQFKPSPEITITREQVDHIPYASIYAKIEGQGAALVVLAFVEGAGLRWVTPERQTMVTRSGRLVETGGLQENIKTVRFLFPDPVADISGGISPSRRYGRLVDLSPGGKYGINIQCAIREMGVETIEIVELSYEARHFIETCTAQTLGWRFENHFWMDAKTGKMWRSIQHIGPGSPPVQIDILKPYDPS